MSKRGLSMEEKKTKMLEIFHENSEFFTMKELEKVAPKLKGIVQQSVKDVIDDLLSDNLITMDKIGTGNYYWSFPSATGAMKMATVDKAKNEQATLDVKIKELRAELGDACKGREDTAERRRLLDQLAEVRATSDSLKAELAAFGAADPVKYERKRKAVNVCREAAQRWTDNTMILIQFSKSLGMEEAQIREMLGIDEDWEDLPH